jgi:MFS family permease
VRQNGVVNHPTLNEGCRRTIGRGLQLCLLAAAMACGGYVRTAISPLQETLRLALSLSDNQMAVLQGPVIGIPVALAALPLGFLIDRYSRARLLFVLIVLSLVGTLLTAFAVFASNFALLLLARGVAGLTGLATAPVVFSLVADLYVPAQRGRATTVVCIGQIAGNSAAFALGGALLAMSDSTPHGWQWAVLWLIAPLVPVVFLMLALREPPRTGVAIASPSARQVWGELRHYRGVIGSLLIGIILAEMAVGAMLIWAAPMLSRNFGLTPERIGALMAMGMLVSGILGTMIGGALADISQHTGGARRSISLLSGLALLAAPVGLFAFVPWITAAVVLLVSAMTLMSAISVMGVTVFSIVIPNELRGLCMSALVALSILFSLAVAPPAVSLLSGAIGGLAMIGKALSVVCALASLIAAATFALGRRFVPLATNA